MTIERRSFIAGIGALAALPAAAQQLPDNRPRVVLETSQGRIVLALEAEKAPATVANFLRYVENRRYDGGVFYRAMRDATVADWGLIQGGQARNDGRRFPPVIHEPTTLTGLKNRAGAISMARGALNSATSDFFILIADMPGLDADPSQPGDNFGFAPFGEVVEGMDIVRNIHQLPTSDQAEVEAMRGQMLAEPVRITSMRKLGG